MAVLENKAMKFTIETSLSHKSLQLKEPNRLEDGRGCSKYEKTTRKINGLVEHSGLLETYLF